MKSEAPPMMTAIPSRDSYFSQEMSAPAGADNPLLPGVGVEADQGMEPPPAPGESGVDHGITMG